MSVLIDKAKNELETFERFSKITCIEVIAELEQLEKNLTLIKNSLGHVRCNAILDADELEN